MNAKTSRSSTCCPPVTMYLFTMAGVSLTSLPSLAVYLTIPCCLSSAIVYSLSFTRLPWTPRATIASRNCLNFERGTRTSNSKTSSASGATA